MGHKRPSHPDEVKKETLPAGKALPKVPSISPTILVLALMLLAGIVWVSFYGIHTKQVAGSDDREYASIARNIVHGKGIVRNFIYPVEINFFEKAPPVPEFVHPPGYPLILAASFTLFGINTHSALIPSYLSYFVLVLLVFFFGRRFVGDRTAALAAVLLAVNKEILDVSLVALSEPVYAVVFLLFFFFFWKAKSLREIVLAGFLMGISHLVRENLYPFLLPLLVYLYFYPDLSRWKKLVFFGVGVLIPLVPNLLRSYLDTGTPFFSYGKFPLMAYTAKYPWLNIYRDIQNPSLFEFLTETPGQFLAKYLNNVTTILDQLISVTNPYVMVFFLLELFHWNTSPEWNRGKLLFLFMMVFQIFFLSVFTFTPRFFVPFLPLMILFASRSMIRVSEDLISRAGHRWQKGIPYLFALLFLVLILRPAAYAIFQPVKPEALGFKVPQYGFLITEQEAKAVNDFLKKEIKENHVVWTDLPEILEWEGDRLCGWLPTRIQSIYEIRKKVPVDALLLTNIQTPYKMEEEWKYLLFSDLSLPKYRTVKIYKGPRVQAKLLIRDDQE
jgi:4-amino-4-deoxy-L-arabinose transferase-like glycosyltransferase